MYNRYIPQSDGSYKRNHIPEPQQHRPPPRPAPQKPAPPPEPAPVRPPLPPKKSPPCKQGGSAADFLKGLLPKDLDTGDLLIIVLLLLMAGDCAEEKNSALLTLALYLFL